MKRAHKLSCCWIENFLVEARFEIVEMYCTDVPWRLLLNAEDDERKRNTNAGGYVNESSVWKLYNPGVLNIRHLMPYPRSVRPEGKRLCSRMIFLYWWQTRPISKTEILKKTRTIGLFYHETKVFKLWNMGCASVCKSYRDPKKTTV